MWGWCKDNEINAIRHQPTPLPVLEHLATDGRLRLTVYDCIGGGFKYRIQQLLDVSNEPVPADTIIWIDCELGQSGRYDTATTALDEGLLDPCWLEKARQSS
jgi:hypothetical protein